MLEDLGQKEMTEKYFRNEDLYQMKVPKDTEGMILNLEKKYDGKLLLKEIALFSGT